MGFRKNREEATSEIPAHLLRTSPYAPVPPSPAAQEAARESSLVSEAVAHMDELKLEAQESVVDLDNAEAAQEVVRIAPVSDKKPKNALVSLVEPSDSKEEVAPTVKKKTPNTKKSDTANKAGKTK